MDKKKCILSAFLVLLVSFCLCLFLYRADNKYTHPGSQPVSGVFYLSRQELSEQPLHYLIRDWVFYPGVLLEPDQLRSCTDYRCYVDVGGRNHMQHGSGTYALTLMLPGGERQYALELPEIFSACSLYINGAPALQMGEPDPAHYREEIGSRVVSFSAAGQTELLLQVSDFSGVYSGMIYPPALGELSALLSVRDGRLLLHGMGVLLAVLGALLALSFGLRENPARGLLVSLACLCLALSTGYPLFHRLLHTAFRPWYVLEAVGYYGLLLLAVLLRSGPVRSRPGKLLLALPCVLGVLGALIRFGLAAWLPPAAGPVFSSLSLAVKYYAAACLIVLSLLSMLRKEQRSVLPLCGSAALAVCLVCDRLFPLYEPIYGGWFAELGGVLLVGFLGVSLWLEALEAYRFRLTYQEGYRQMEQRLDMQKSHYSQLTEQIQRSREASHNMRHHLRTLRGLAEQGRLEELSAYLDACEPHAAEKELQIWCENPAVDAVLGYYAAEAKKAGAAYDVRMALPPVLPFPEDELCILLGNLLENAVDAMAAQKDGRRALYLRGDLSDGQLRLVLDNSFSGVLRTREGRFLSTKHDGVGLGISSVEAIVARCGGLADFSAERRTFHVSVLIPLAQS